MPAPSGRPRRRAEPAGEDGREEAPERVQKTLARAGYGSRRSTEDLIRAGRVRIGRRIAQLGDRVDPSIDQVFVDESPIPAHPDLRYFAFNKPAGVTTTLRDPHAGRSLAFYLPPGPRVFPVGRLDRESEGLILLTNDGELAHRVQHPRYGIEKEYMVEVEGLISRGAAQGLLRGVRLEDGPARALAVGPIQRSRRTSGLTLVMAEGRKRVVRRMLDSVGHPVRRLVRIRVGPIRLGSTRPGSARALRPAEIAALYSATGLQRARPRPRRGPRGGDEPSS
jgi:23S rRNA pseudouridine2605 synthase